MKILIQYAIMNHMSKLAHLYQPIIWYKCKSLQMWFVIPNCNKIFIFAVLEWWLIHFNETECSFVYLINYYAQIARHMIYNCSVSVSYWHHKWAPSFIFKGQLQRKFFFISINELWLYQITIYVIKSLSKISHLTKKRNFVIFILC